MESLFEAMANICKPNASSELKVRKYKMFKGKEVVDVLVNISLVEDGEVLAKIDSLVKTMNLELEKNFPSGDLWNNCSDHITHIERTGKLM